MKIYEEIPNDKAKQFCKDFLHKNVKRFLFGTNDYALSIAKALNNNIDGYINDFTQEKYFYGIPIVRLNALPKDSLIVSCVVLSQAININKKLANFRNLDYFSFAKYSNLPIKQVEFVNKDLDGNSLTIYDAKLDIQKNEKKYQDIFHLLYDEYSKIAFEKCCNFRYSSDLRFLEGFEYTPATQYFEDFISYKDVEMFIDIGAYHGETSLEFIKRNPHYSSIHCFEPESKNFTQLSKNCKKYPHVFFYKYGVGEERKSIYISKDSGSANKIIQNTNGKKIDGERIDIVTLDSIFMPLDSNPSTYQCSNTDNAMIYGGG